MLASSLKGLFANSQMNAKDCWQAFNNREMDAKTAGKHLIIVKRTPRPLASI